MDTVTIGNSTLPAVCHVVCTLIATGITGINVTTPSPVPAIDQTTPQLHQPTPFPDGYVAHPDVGFAYKVHDENVTWIEARKRCTEEGAQLALIDSTKKLEYVKYQKKSTTRASVGIVRMYNQTMWVAVSTGVPVSALPWKIGEPYGVDDCVKIDFDENGLGNYICTTETNFICELPIL